MYRKLEGPFRYYTPTPRRSKSKKPVASICRFWHSAPVAKKPDKALVLLSGEIKTPPLSVEARREAGFLLRRLQQGELLSLQHCGR